MYTGHNVMHYAIILHCLSEFSSLCLPNSLFGPVVPDQHLLPGVCTYSLQVILKAIFLQKDFYKYFTLHHNV